jgi:DNA polymerase III delta subunit
LTGRLPQIFPTILEHSVIAIALGPDDTLVRDAVRDILRERDPQDMNTTRLDGRVAKPGDVQTAAASAGFFGTGRVVVVDDFLARYAKPAGRAGAAAPDWKTLFAAIPAENTLLLVDASLATVPAAVKKALPADAVIRLGDPPRGRDLIRWMVDAAKQEQGKLGDREARFLAERLYPQSWAQKGNNPAYDRPPNLGLVRQEIARLALSAYPGDITVDLIKDQVDRGDDDRIFKFLDAALAGNLEIAMPELDRLLVAGEEPGRLLAQLAQSVELSAVIANSGNRDPVSVGKDIGASNPNRMTVIARGVQTTGTRRVNVALEAITTADRRIKRGELHDQLDGLYEVLTTIAATRQRH